MKLGLSIGYSRAHLEVPVALVQRAEELATTRSSRRKPTAPMRYGDGWMPHRTRTQYADVQALLPKFREMAVDAGRDPASVPIWGAGEDRDLPSAIATTAPRAWSSAWIPARPIRSCRNSTAGRR